MRLLDGDRLMDDLLAVAETVGGRVTGLTHRYRRRWVLLGMSRAWRVIAAAIEDGEYDVREGE